MKYYVFFIMLWTILCEAQDSVKSDNKWILKEDIFFLKDDLVGINVGGKMEILPKVKAAPHPYPISPNGRWLAASVGGDRGAFDLSEGAKAMLDNSSFYGHFRVLEVWQEGEDWKGLENETHRKAYDDFLIEVLQIQGEDDAEATLKRLRNSDSEVDQEELKGLEDAIVEGMEDRFNERVSSVYRNTFVGWFSDNVAIYSDIDKYYIDIHPMVMFIDFDKKRIAIPTQTMRSRKQFERYSPERLAGYFRLRTFEDASHANRIPNQFTILATTNGVPEKAKPLVKAAMVRAFRSLERNDLGDNDEKDQAVIKLIDEASKGVDSKYLPF